MAENYFNTLSMKLKLEELGTCRLMDAAEFANGIEAAKGKKKAAVTVRPKPQRGDR